MHDGTVTPALLADGHYFGWYRQGPKTAPPAVLIAYDAHDNVAGQVQFPESSLPDQPSR
jgi:hypothetical protein